ncbi:MAG TPA: hypothetical protein VN892_13025 [Solirubrobacteraceae bacterium]|nr:hypothetical protein [Solirubrobacteraceae bacterium]
MSALDKLLQTPPAEIVSDLKTVRDERAILESKEAMLEQLLEMLSRQGGEVAQEIAALGASVAIGPLRNQILQVVTSMRQEDDLLTTVPAAVQEALIARGNRKVTVDNVRVTMKRMADSNELERPVPGQNRLFALPGTADAFPERIAELTALIASNSQ